MSEDKLNTVILEKIINRLEENNSTLQAMDKKLDLHIQETKYEFKAIRDLDVLQNSILEEHHKRSDRLAEDNALREQAIRNELSKQEVRIEKLEAPRKWLETTKKWLIGLGAAAAGVAAIYEALQHFLMGK